MPTEMDKVVAIEKRTRRMVNSNVACFGAFLAIYRDYLIRVRDLDEEDALALIDQVERRMISADRRAMEDENGYWPMIVEQMREGTL